MANIARAENPFGQVNESAATEGALALQEQQRGASEIQSALVIAKKFPRDPVAAMDRILNACSRPALAEMAEYQYSRGGQDVVGPSIRLTEVLAQQWGNMRSGVTEVSRGAGWSECVAYSWDLETNTYEEKRFRVSHFRDTKAGRKALTDERDIYEHIANMGARRKRACQLAVIPGDVVESAQKQCAITLSAKADTSPEAVQKMVAAFGQFGVTASQIEKRIQRRLDAITAAQIVSLRRIHNSLRDGISSVEQWFEPTANAAPTTAQAAPKARGTQGLKDKLKPAPAPSPAPSETEGNTETGEIDPFVAAYNEAEQS